MFRSGRKVPGTSWELLSRGAHPGLEHALSPPSPSPPVAVITGPSWCPAEPKCHPRTLPEPPVDRRLIRLSCLNPVSQVRTLRARQGSDVPSGAQCGPAAPLSLTVPSCGTVTSRPGTQSCRSCLLEAAWLCLVSRAAGPALQTRLKGSTCPHALGLAGHPDAGPGGSGK